MRLKNWETELHTYFESCRTTPFKWGEFDCCVFAAKCVEILTGENHYAAFDGRYRTERGSLTALKRYGTGELESTISKSLGEPVAPLLLGRGDIALMQTDGLLNQAVAVCWSGFLIQPGTHGLVHMPMQYAVRGWRVV